VRYVECNLQKTDETDEAVKGVLTDGAEFTISRRRKSAVSAEGEPLSSTCRDDVLSPWMALAIRTRRAAPYAEALKLALCA
jgi:hypothetical protein